MAIENKAGEKSGVNEQPDAAVQADAAAKAQALDINLHLRGGASRTPDETKIRSALTESISELTLVDGHKLARKADGHVYGTELKHVLANLPLEQLEAVKKKFEEKTGGKLDVAALDKIKDFSPQIADRIKAHEDHKNNTAYPHLATRYGSPDMESWLKIKAQVKDDREQLALALNDNRTPEDDRKLATIGINKNRGDLTSAAVQNSPQIKQEVLEEKIAAAVIAAADEKEVGIRIPDKDGIQAILESLPPETVRRIDEASEKLRGEPLRDEVKKLLNTGLYSAMVGGGQYELVSRYFERQSASDEAGQIRAAMESLDRAYLGKFHRQHGPTERAEQDILKTVAVMSAADKERVDKELTQNKGMSLEDLSNHPRMSKAAQDTLKVLLSTDQNGRGADQINAMLDIAQKERRLDILKLALRLAPENTRDDIREHRQDSLVKTFTEGTIFKDYYKKNVVDYINEGKMSLSTLIAGNTKFLYELTNTKEIDRLVENASPEERAKYKNDPDYRKRVDETLDNAARVWFGYESAIWKAKLKDDEGLTVAMLKLGGPEIFGHRPTRAEWSKTLEEKFGPKEFEHFKNNPTDLARFEKDLHIVFSKGEKMELMARLKEKLGADTFEDGATRANRSIGDLIAYAKTPVEKAQALYTPISQEDVPRLKAAMETSWKAGSPERILGEYVLTRLGQGDNAKYDPMEKVALANLVPDKPIESVRAIEAALKENPGRILDANKNDAALIESAFTKAMDKAGIHKTYDELGNLVLDYQAPYRSLFTTGRLDLSHRLDLVSGMQNKRDLLVQDATAEEIAKLKNPVPNLEELKLQMKALGTGEQKELSLKVLSQEGYSVADMARSFVLGDRESWVGQKLDHYLGADASKITDTLQSLPREQASKVALEYFTKYGTLMSQDLLAKVAPADRLLMRQALSNFELPPNQIAMMARQERDGSSGARPFDWLSTFLDYSSPGAKESNDALISMIAHKRDLLEAHDPKAAREFEQGLKSYLSAEENHADTKRVLWALAMPIQAGGWTGAAYLIGKNLPWVTAVLSAKMLGKAQALSTLAVNRAILGPKQYTTMDAALDLGAMPFASIKATYLQLGKRGLGHLGMKPGTHLAAEAGTTAIAATAASTILTGLP